MHLNISIKLVSIQATASKLKLNRSYGWNCIQNHGSRPSVRTHNLSLYLYTTKTNTHRCAQCSLRYFGVLLLLMLLLMLWSSPSPIQKEVRCELEFDFHVNQCWKISLLVTPWKMSEWINLWWQRRRQRLQRCRNLEQIFT